MLETEQVKSAQKIILDEAKRLPILIHSLTKVCDLVSKYPDELAFRLDDLNEAIRVFNQGQAPFYTYSESYPNTLTLLGSVTSLPTIPELLEKAEGLEHHTIFDPLNTTFQKMQRYLTTQRNTWPWVEKPKTTEATLSWLVVAGYGLFLEEYLPNNREVGILSRFALLEILQVDLPNSTLSKDLFPIR